MKKAHNFCNNFWNGKKVLITGHTGFKGSWLTLWLQYLGAEIIGFALPPKDNPNLFSLLQLEKNINNIFGDIRNYAAVNEVIKTHRPEIIIHMAAQSLVRYSYQEPLETYETNVMGTVNILEALRTTQGVKVFLNITTDKCYENKEWCWGYRENDNLGGQDPYSNSKACSELVTAAYRNSYFNTNTNQFSSLASARAGNVIGGGDWSKDRLIPDIISACMNNRSLTIRNPYAIRPWQHVFDPLHGYLLLAYKLYSSGSEFAEAWNFGPNDSDGKPVSWIASYIMNEWGNHQGWKIESNPQPHESQQLKLDCTKSRSKLKWNAYWDLEKSLYETVGWYKAYQDKKNMCEFSLAQLTQYLNCVTTMQDSFTTIGEKL